jgi:alkylhydroperoxidase family enzyme
MPRAIGRLNASLTTRTHVSHELLDLIGLVVSQENSCRFCFAAQRALMLSLGTPRKRIDQLEQDFASAELSEADRLALDFARRIARANPLPTPEDRQPLLDAGFSSAEISEIVAAVANHVFFNRMSTLAAMPPTLFETLPDRWYVRVLQPLLAMKLRSWQRTRPPVAASAYAGPYASALASVGELHSGQMLREIVEQLWHSPETSQRSKALVFAVVARALGCERGEAESLRLVAEAGLPPVSAQAILTHLDSPELDAFERAALPFARETAWSPASQVPRLQTRSREVQQLLSPSEFLSLLAVSALANSLCRIGAVAPAD